MCVRARARVLSPIDEQLYSSSIMPSFGSRRVRATGRADGRCFCNFFYSQYKQTRRNFFECFRIFSYCGVVTLQEVVTHGMYSNMAWYNKRWRIKIRMRTTLCRSGERYSHVFFSHLACWSRCLLFRMSNLRRLALLMLRYATRIRVMRVYLPADVFSYIHWYYCPIRQDTLVDYIQHRPSISVANSRQQHRWPSTVRRDN